MLSNYYTLRYICSTLTSTLRGLRVREVFSQNKDELVVAFKTSGLHLVISCRQDASTLYLHGDFVRAKRNTVDLFPETSGTTVTGVAIHSADRIITVGLGADMRLAVLVFGARSNVLLLDPGGKVLGAFKNARKLAGSIQGLAGSELTYDFPAFYAATEGAGSAAVASVIKKSFPVLGTTLVHESLARAGVAPSLSSSHLTAPLLDAIAAAIRSVLEDLHDPHPRVYMDAEGIPSLFSIIALRQSDGMEERVFDDIHDAVRFFIAKRKAAAGTQEDRSAVVSTLRQVIEKARRTRLAINADARGAERADEYERFGSVLMSHLDAIAKGSRSVTLSSIEGTETISLEASLSPVQNAQRYYEKAKRSRVAAREAEGRMKELDEKIARGEHLLTAAEGIPTRNEVKKFISDHAAELDEFGIGQRSKKREVLPFRIFVVDGGFEVWAGKNSANNDLLTLRHTRPDDLWFHARGAGGSHVVLKVGTGKGEPGKKAREQAAGIAAYYSKMKNATMVPVAMTEKRYVRKPRGALPGTVVLEREKVIFAEPGLPSQAGNA